MTGVTVQQAIHIAISHQNAGRLELAEAVYRQILGEVGERADVLHLLCSVAAQLGRGDAQAIARRALALDSSAAETHSVLATLLWRQKRYDESIGEYQLAIELRPDFGPGYYNLAIPLADAGRVEQAITALRKATALAPEYGPAWYNLGCLMNRIRQLESAAECFAKSAQLQPHRVEAFNNLGVALTDTGRFGQAIEAFHTALRLQPGHGQVLHNLGRAQLMDGQIDQAVETLSAALALSPPVTIAANNLGRALVDRGEVDRGLDVFAAAVEKLPDSLPLHENILFSMQYSRNVTAAQMRQQGRMWNGRFARPLMAEIRPHPNTRDANRRLRIGYLSPDFREHCQSFFTVPLLSHHDHAAFEIHAYSLCGLVDDTARHIRGLVDVWHDASALGDRELAEMIRADGIDVLVDLTLHMSNSRLLALARKPAPVQVTWLGYPGSTGLETMDWRLSDPYLDPPGADLSIYSERTWRLPDTFWCYRCPEGEVPVGALPMLANGFVTFGCLNNFCKVNDETIELWSAVLKRVERSQMILLAPPGEARRRVLAVFEREGVDGGRIRFVPRQSRAEYLKCYGDIDLALDTFPYAGHTTSLDGLWMGVPVVSLYGERCVSRGGLSQLSNLGLAELATDNPERFVEIAVDWANDKARLADLRGRLRSHMQESTLTDGVRFSVNMEKAYRGIWSAWCGG